MRKIPLMVPNLGQAEIDLVSQAILSGWVAQGPLVSEFEKQFAKKVGAVEAIAVSNCTTGLQLALIVGGVTKGDDVVVPSFSYIATTNAVVHAGANPVFADVSIETGNLTVETMTNAITASTKAVILVHQAGVPAQLDEIKSLCDLHGILLIEDAACAIGSKYKDDLIGSHSSLVVFSFHPRKVLTTGEGGMICTSNPEWASRLRRLREHGMSLSAADRHAQGGVIIEKYTETGYNYRLTDLQAGLGIAQLGKLDEMVIERRKQAKIYRESFESHPRVINMISDTSYGLTNFQSFWIRLDTNQSFTRNSVMVDLDNRGITTRRGIMVAHREAACERFFTSALPVSEMLSDSTVILPVFHSLTESDQSQIIEVFLEVLGK